MEDQDALLTASKDTTSMEPKKITIFSNLNISTAYSISSEEFKWSPVRMSTALNFFENKLNINFKFLTFLVSG